MNGGFILSTAVLFFMLMDPFGNLPVFIARLRHLSPRRYTFIIWRESWIALLLMVLALLAGQPFLRMMHIPPSAVAIGGGVILLLMGVRMVFSSFGGAGEDDDETAAEPLLSLLVRISSSSIFGSTMELSQMIVTEICVRDLALTLNVRPGISKSSRAL